MKGFLGETHYSVHIETLKWYWEDDQGKLHKCLISKSYYVPEGGVRLLSPQRWDQSQKDIKPNPGTMENTDHQSSILHWNQGKYKEQWLSGNTTTLLHSVLHLDWGNFYEATAGFYEATGSNIFIADQVRIIEEGNLL